MSEIFNANNFEEFILYLLKEKYSKFIYLYLKDYVPITKIII